MTTFYSHSKQPENGPKYGSKKLIDHTAGVSANALFSLYPKVNLQLGMPIKDILGKVCLYHDLGKYTTHFQRYLLDLGDYKFELKQHAKFGGFALYQKLKSEGLEQEAVFAAYLIIHHHSSLTNFGELKEYSVAGSNHEDIFSRQLATLSEHFEQIASELSEPDLVKCLAYPPSSFRGEIKRIQKRPEIQNYFLLNYLFSLLIEADKLDASDTKLYERIAIPSLLVEKSIGKSHPIHTSHKILHTLSQNELRAYARAVALSHLDATDILTRKLFTLTAPTGIGKTLTALDFALRLKEKIRIEEGYEAQIIYALPFINIIEQAIKEYDKVVGKEGLVLAHYQFADAFEQLTKGQNLTEQENKDYNQQTMLLDTWQSDIVITTFVQFLQTLIGNRNKLLKKFHHLAGAIVILDEVQTIKLDYLPLVGAALFYLSKFLNTRVILMTATKPKTFELANREIIQIQDKEEKAAPLELLTGFEKVFTAFSRTKIVPLIEATISDEKAFLDSYFAKKWSSDKSCLVVLNLVKRSIDVFSAIKDYLDKKGLSNPIYYLSTNIVPCHRLEIIERVKADLRAKTYPILISTQSVEAGVDLDFDMGFRDLGPIDSIIQVAGRINRENTPERQNAPLYIVDFDDCMKIYERLTTIQARNALEKGTKDFGTEIHERHYLTLIETYYESLSAIDTKSFREARMFFESMKNLNYTNEDKSTYPVSDFQVIEQRGGISSVFIEIDNVGTAAKEAFQQLLSSKKESEKKKLKEDFDKKFKLHFHQRIISIPDYLPKAKELKLDKRNKLYEGLYIVNADEIDDYYDLITGFDRSKENVPAHQTVML